MTSNVDNYLEEIEHLRIPNKIKKYAMTLISKMKVGIVKCRKRKMLIVLTVYLSYQKIDHTTSVEFISERLGMEYDLCLSYIKKGLNIYFEYLGGNYVNHVPPTKYIDIYFDKLKFSYLKDEFRLQLKKDILFFSKTILDENPIFYEYSPQIIASSLILYFINLYIPKEKKLLNQLSNISRKNNDLIRDKMNMLKKIYNF